MKEVEMRNRGERNAFIDRKSWKGCGGCKKSAKTAVSRATRRGGKFAIRHALAQ